MRTESGKAVYLSEYKVPDYLIDQVDLDFSLAAENTLVQCTLRMRPNPIGRTGAPLMLDGDELTVVSVEMNGQALDSADASITPDGLTIASPPQEPFVLRTVTRIDPAANTQLSGLYQSGAVYCTQCEAEGFRRITYFLDRPDVLSIYTTRMEADRTLAPVLLGNGNPVEAGLLPDNRHFATWQDPHPKPCYLFALVAGDLAAMRESYVTRSGSKVDLNIYVEKGKQDRAAYAMDSLIRSMRWDEEVYGREYDLDVFNIVAVSDFNMGAMENKGLNIFNDKYILASPETATDTDYAGIETVVAHEYFHNWTGNRITCRDWFQLCLKEGLTVFRDQEFSSDMRSRAVCRIGDVRALRSAQFSEDAGPLAHNVRPDQYHEINNFYTATVYQKGAEVIRMLRTLIGDDAFYRGMNLYFDRFDGTAATVEDFISCFEESSGRSLAQFMRWYNQSGTPRVVASGSYDQEAGTFTLALEQDTPPTPGQDSKEPLVIPVTLGLVGENGADIPLQTAVGACDFGASDHELAISALEFSEDKRTIVFTGVREPVVPSLMRGFSAPVHLEYDYSEAELLWLIASDRDQFNRWQAAQTYATRLIIASVGNIRANRAAVDPAGFCTALAPVLANFAADMEFTAQMLSLPGENDIAREIAKDVDPEAIYQARTALRQALGAAHHEALRTIYNQAAELGGKKFDPAASGPRALKAAALALIAAADPSTGSALAKKQLANTSTMTDKISALNTLGLIGGDEAERAFAEFYTAHEGDSLVIDKWFSLQSMIPDQSALSRIRTLIDHPAFSVNNPNRLRSVVASFAFGNPRIFNAPDGSGYELLGDIVREIDPRNPQIAARLLTAFKSWKGLEKGRRGHAERVLRDIAAVKVLSADVRDIVTRSLA